MMKSDIQNREDLYLIVSDFYKKLLIDKDMKHFFEKFNDESHLEEHLQVLVDFWDNILFYSGTYQKNAMLPHIELNKTKPFKKLHFDIWINHFSQSIDDNFTGENAEITKNRARSIATVMQLKTLKYS
ncbi:MAG: group III truncated hemoglobin [Flavobacteriaceae bacterium]|nr:group III truncated hemoglobin [Flavobacteriaceae bacterium]